ncbi:MAG: glycosyltransferase [Promethearchaeota archaeon]
MTIIMKELSKSLISLVVPFHESTACLESLRQQLNLVKTPIEVILVIDKKLESVIEKKKPYERIVSINNKGRGYNFAEGVRNATGDIIVFLHSDTRLPPRWDILIRNALLQDEVVGGAFSLKFDYANNSLKVSYFIGKLLYLITGELWGDRTIFIRSKFIKDNLSVLEVPIMEDVRLSRWMNTKGRVVVLKENVTTSFSAFLKFGWVHHSLRILKARMWYALGGDPHKIFNYYYSR